MNCPKIWMQAGQWRHQHWPQGGGLQTFCQKPKGGAAPGLLQCWWVFCEPCRGGCTPGGTCSDGPGHGAGWEPGAGSSAALQPSRHWQPSCCAHCARRAAQAARNLAGTSLPASWEPSEHPACCPGCQCHGELPWVLTAGLGRPRGERGGGCVGSGTGAQGTAEVGDDVRSRFRA